MLLAFSCLALCGFLLFLADATVLPAPVIHESYEPPDPSHLDGATNLLLRAPVTASPHWSDRKPEFAVDGRHDSAGDHWAAENIPVHLTVDLGLAKPMNIIRLWTYWDDRRYYQYVIEGSADGDSWVVLADERSNTAPATSAGRTFVFPTSAYRYVRTTFTHNSAGNVAGGHIVEIEAYLVSSQAAADLADAQNQWSGIPDGLQLGVGTTDVRYARNAPPSGVVTGPVEATGWRGERVSAQLLLWSRQTVPQVRLQPSGLTGPDGATIPLANVRMRFVRYVGADGKIVPDILDDAALLDLPARTTRPVWVSVDIPRDVPPGQYAGTLTVAAQAGVRKAVDLRIQVQAPQLPPPEQWQFYLDLWQNPYAVARYHHVEPWSPEHLLLLDPHLRMLAQAGQKCITATIVHQAWGTQTYDPYESMVQWIRRADGSWAFDFADFDTWVELCLKCGITQSISCYSMVPWTNRVRYLDEATGDWASLAPALGSKAYEDLWKPFLAAFVEHLKARGWLERTNIAMDERTPEQTQAMRAMLKEAAPELGIALAGSNHPELKDLVDDWCVFIGPPLDPAIAQERRAKGLPTTFYVCCGPGRPNTFTFSPPAESEWIGWYAAAMSYDGFLRWAYDSWVQDPLQDTSYVRWPAGDCFLVYPGARSSIRFERLREGIIAWEKVRLLREALQAKGDAGREGLRRLDEVLAGFRYDVVQKEPAQVPVRTARQVVEELAAGL
jgi:hypothetical protein